VKERGDLERRLYNCLEGKEKGARKHERKKKEENQQERERILLNLPKT